MFEIQSIGNGAFLEQVLNAVAMITGTGDFEQVVAIGLLLGVIAAMVTGIMQGAKGIPIQNVFVGFIIYLVMFGSGQTVTIQDRYDQSVRVVDNVPLGVAAAGSVISSIGYKLTELFETAYSPISSSFTEVKYADSLQLINGVRRGMNDSSIWQALNKTVGPNADFRQSWDNYIRDCTLLKIDRGELTHESMMQDSLIKSIEFPSLTFQTKIFVGPPGGEDLSCTVAFSQLNGATNLTDNVVMNALQGNMGEKVVDSGEFLAKMDNAIQSLGMTGVSAAEYQKTAILDRIYLEAAAGKYKDFHDYAAAQAVNQAISQRDLQWATEQTLFMTIVRPMMSFFEAFTFAVTPFMAFLIVFGAGGMGLAAKYVTLLLWVQLWMPVLSITNLYIHMAATGQMASMEQANPGFKWDSMYGLNESSNVLQHWIATGGMLAAATPAITLMLIYGGAVTATHLAGRLQGVDHINEKMMSPDLRNTPELVHGEASYGGNKIEGYTSAGSKGLMSAVNLKQTTDKEIASQTTAGVTASTTALKAFENMKASNYSIGESASVMRSLGRDIHKAEGSSFDKIRQRVQSEKGDQTWSNDKLYMKTAEHAVQSAATAGLSVLGSGITNTASFTSKGTSSEGNKSSSGHTNSATQAHSFSKSEKAELTDRIANNFKADYGKNFSTTDSESDAVKLQKSFVGMDSSQDAITRLQKMNNQFSSGTGSDAYILAKRAIDTGNTEARELINSQNNGWNLSGVEKDQFGTISKQYGEAQGGDGKTSQLAAKIHHLLNSGEGEEREQNSQVVAQMMSMVVSGGSNVSQQGSAYEHKELEKPDGFSVKQLKADTDDLENIPQAEDVSFTVIDNINKVKNVVAAKSLDEINTENQSEFKGKEAAAKPILALPGSR